jgi:Leucine-rich repeat (LRR) protein
LLEKIKTVLFCDIHTQNHHIYSFLSTNDEKLISTFSLLLLAVNALLQKLSERAFDGLSNLRLLNLQNNKITQLEHGVFTSLPALASLNLNSNALTTLTYNTVLPLYENLVNNSALLTIKGKFIVSSPLPLSHSRFSTCVCLSFR